MAAESRVAVGAQRLYKLSTEEAGAWDISVAAGSYDSPLMLSVGTLAADGAFQAAESLYLVPDAATTSLRGVCTPAGQELYICVQATQGTSDFSLNISGTQAATAGLVTQDNSPAAATALAADGSTTHGWVGYGDAADFYRVQMDSAGSLSIALAELADISERRIESLVNPSISGLPAFLVENGGLNSGFMIVQYTAAALVSENKVLAHPASVDSIPSSGNQEDHVSMGTIAARKAGEIMGNLRRVIAMELMCACQAIDLRSGKDGLGIGTRAAYEAVRSVCPMLKEDRPLYEDINRCESLLHGGILLSAVREAYL
jgi:hypothetical protein